MNRIPFPLNDGGAIGSYNFVKGYAEAGCKVTVLTMNTTRHYVNPEKVKDTMFRYAAMHMVAIDNRIKPLPALLNLFKKESYITERFKSDSYALALQKLLTTEHFDVVHVDGLPCALYVDIIRQYSSARISYRAHNVEHLMWQRIADKELNPLKKWYLKLQAARVKEFEYKAMQSVDVVMSISREDDDAIQVFCPKATTKIVPAGMDVPDTKPLSNEEVNPLFFIGAFDWMPNLQGVEWFFSEIWPGLIAQLPSLRFQIAGKKMPETIFKLQSDYVTPLGEVPDSTTFILSGGVMVVPIISGSGIRIKIMEAMALGKCIVATSIAAEGLGVQDGEHILIANTVDEFADKLGKCIKDTEYRKAIAQNAHTFALHNFQNKKIFEKLVSHYRSLS
ncbi:MAG: glycosyltransferase [Bacteroidetes bacterium]|nr:glycosyltransferase [Bacteroidota bacterium]